LLTLAATHFDFALGLCRDYGNLYSDALVLTHVGDERHAIGELPQAREAQACRRAGDKFCRWESAGDRSGK
jgi:hypothetical protein